MKHLKKIAAHGRNGDTELAHLTPGEVIIPKSAQTPEVRALLAALLGESGHDIGRYTVGGGDDSRNPKTKLREYYDGGESGNDATGGGNAGNMGGYDGGGYAGAGGGQIADLTPQDQQALGFNPNDLADTRSVDISVGPNEAAAGSWARETFGNKGFGKVAGWAGDRIGRMADRPVETALNAFAAFTPVGAINTASGLLNGPTVGSMGTAMGRGLANMSMPETQVAGKVDGKSTGAISPTGDDPNPQNEGGDGYNPTQSGASGSGMSPLAQALAGYGITNDGWNNWGRRKTLGPLVNSYDPNGRQYVTPWDYRG